MLSADFEFELKHNVRQALRTQCTEFLEHLRALLIKPLGTHHQVLHKCLSHYAPSAV